MALINCPECNKEVSDIAKTCPNCGFPISEIEYDVEEDNDGVFYKKPTGTLPPIEKKPMHKSVVTFIQFIIIIAIILSINSCLNSDNSDSTKEKTPQDYASYDEYVEAQRIVPEETKLEVSVTEELIYDDKDVKIYVKSIEEKASEYLLNLNIENNSSLNLGFNAHAYSINKIMTNNNIYDMDYDVAAGKKTIAQLEIKKSLLEELKISEIKNIDILIWAYDNDKSFKEFDTGILSIKTNLDDGNYSFSSGNTVYEKDGIKIEYLNNSDGNYNYCISNTTGNYFDFTVENITINDCTSSDWYLDLTSVMVFDGCQTLFEIKPDEEFLELNSIDNIESIEFNLDVRPLEDYFESYKTEVISIEL